jgi:hypothetical protein
MRLLRLRTDNKNCEFDTAFNSDIIIKPNSKLALQNLCITKTPETIVIDASNDNIQIQISAGDGTADAKLEHRSYTKQNFNELLSDISYQLNACMGWARRTQGIQWRASIINNRVDIEYKQPQKQLLLTPDLMSSAVVRNVTLSGTSYITGNDNAEGTSYVYWENPITQGQGGFNVLTRELIDTENPFMPTGFIVGLVERTAGAKLSIPVSSYYCGIHAISEDTNYNTIDQGFGEQSMTLPTHATSGSNTNDILSINIGEGKITMSVYKHASTTAGFTGTILKSIDLPKMGNNDPYTSPIYYPCITIFSATNTACQNIECYLDPYLNNIPITETVEEVQELTDRPPKQTRAKSTHILNFMTPSLPKFLGYSEIFYKLLTNMEVSYLAENIFDAVDISDSFVIEMLSMELNSYDSQTAGRRSILAVVPKSEEDTEGAIVYQVPYPTFISIKNNQELSLRNIRCRILKSDLSKIVVSGFSVMTLLLDE